MPAKKKAQVVESSDDEEETQVEPEAVTQPKPTQEKARKLESNFTKEPKTASDDKEVLSAADVEAAMDVEEKKAPPEFPALTAVEVDGKPGYMRINVPPNRYTPLKKHWSEIYTPLVEHMGMQVRFNPRKKCVELRNTAEGGGNLHKSADFVRAFLLGFEVRDAIALLRLDDLFIDSFEVKDVKTLNGEHLSRAIGRVAGQGGKTKHTIENATKTRIVVADTHIHILGSFPSIQTAKTAIVRLIMGTPPGKVYTQMRNVSNRAKERF